MFPNLKNKKFTDLATNGIVTVIDQFENIAILDNKQRVDVKRLLDNGFYDEHIDPASFFGEKNYQIFADKIKSIPNETLEKMKEDDTAIITNYDPEEEKRALLEKANRMSNPVSAIQDQMEKFKDLIDEEIPVINVNTTDATQPMVQNVSVSNQVATPVQQTPVQQTLTQPSFVDPIITMFNNVKRNTEFNISIDINNKIPRPDFIELMEDSYETSIIDYLADEFTNKILENPNIIKDKIKDEIKSIVYKKSNSIKEEIKEVKQEVKEEKPKIARKKAAPKTEKESPKKTDVV